MSELNPKLFNYGMYLLGRRDYSAKEMAKKFKEKEYQPEEIELVMAHLQERGYQSDERFARSFINSKLGSKIGISKIKSTLAFEKGVDKELIETVVSELELDEVSVIMKIVAQKYRNKDLTDQKEKSKAFRFLVSKGFSFSDIKRALSVDPEDY
jgi:regulatory protein